MQSVSFQNIVAKKVSCKYFVSIKFKDLSYFFLNGCTMYVQVFIIYLKVNGNTVEPLLYDHHQNHIGVVV